jgi:hypothetical protein
MIGTRDYIATEGKDNLVFQLYPISGLPIQYRPAGDRARWIRAPVNVCNPNSLASRTGGEGQSCRRIGARDTRQRRWARLTNWPGLDAHRAPRWECLPCRVEDVIPPTYLALTLTLWTCSPHYSWFSSGAGWSLRPTKNPSDLAMARQARGTS